MIMLLALASLVAILCRPAAPLMAQPSQLSFGASRFDFDYRDDQAARPITIWTYRPKELLPDAPVLVVMHGVQRNGRHYRDRWQPYADRGKALLLVPEFSVANFPGAGGYAAVKPDASSVEEGGTPAAYAAIEQIFDRAMTLTGLKTPDYRIYGHSAGGQFVHRFVMLNAKARMRIAVAANAGWYMLPDFARNGPYGLRGSGITQAQLKASFAKELIVLLGEKDHDPKHPSLSRAAGPMRQGPHRFARGEFFFRTAQEAAAKLNTPFAWKLSTVADADHDNAKMAPAAFTWLMR